MADSERSGGVTRRDVLKQIDGARAATVDSLTQAPSPSSGEPVALQYFHRDWTTIKEDIDRVSDWGFDAIWIQQPAEAKLTEANQEDTDDDGVGEPTLGYQPIDLRNFNSELGTEAELQTLIDTAHGEDVDVYLDTVLNHLANAGYDAFPDFSSRHFHNNGGIDDDAWSFDPGNPDCFNADGSPKDPDKIECKPFQIENHDLLGLKDLRQNEDSPEGEHVRDELKRYLEDMAALGADGYRFDAVKHIPESFFADYANQWAENMDMFRVGEALSGSIEYLDGYVTAGPGMNAFDYPLHYAIDSVFDSGDMQTLKGAGYIAQRPFRAMPFVENHDTGGGPAQYDLAHAFVLTIEGYPVLYNPHPDWLLGYHPIKNMVWVKRNLAGGQTLWRHTDNDLAIYERESNLLVGLNNSGSPQSKWVDTSWTATELKDYAGNAGNVTTESDGRVEIPVPAEGWVFYAPTQDIDVSASGEAGVASGGEATISIAAQTVDQVLIEDLWTDWSLSVTNSGGGTVTDDVADSGSVTVDYDSLQLDASPSITVSMPSRYVGGEYVISVTVTNADGDTAETTATISIA